MKAKRAAADEKNCAACVRPFIDLKRALLSLEFLFLPSSLVVSSSALSVFFSVSQHVLFLLLYPLCGTRKGGERTCLVARPRSEAQDRPSPVRDRPAGRPPPLTRPPLTRPQLYQRDTRYPYTIYLGPSQEDTRAIVLDLCLLPFFLNRG